MSDGEGVVVVGTCFREATIWAYSGYLLYMNNQANEGADE